MPSSIIDHAGPATTQTKSRWSRILGVFRRRRHHHKGGDGNRGEEETAPPDYAGLDEVAAPPPVQNPEDEEGKVYRHRTLEEEQG